MLLEWGEELKSKQGGRGEGQAGRKGDVGILGGQRFNSLGLLEQFWRVVERIVMNSTKDRPWW